VLILATSCGPQAAQKKNAATAAFMKQHPSHAATNLPFSNQRRHRVQELEARQSNSSSEPAGLRLQLLVPTFPPHPQGLPNRASAYQSHPENARAAPTSRTIQPRSFVGRLLESESWHDPSKLLPSSTPRNPTCHARIAKTCDLHPPLSEKWD
jgi:hypothetical protein